MIVVRILCRRATKEAYVIEPFHVALPAVAYDGLSRLKKDTI